jgi:hypothetical protein
MDFIEEKVCMKKPPLLLKQNIALGSKGPDEKAQISTKSELTDKLNDENEMFDLDLGCVI